MDRPCYRVFALVLVAWAAPRPAAAEGLHFGGYVESNLQLGVGDCGGSAGGCEFLNFRNLNLVGLKVEATFGAWAAARADLAIRNLNFTEIETFSDLGSADEVQPVDFRVVEAYIALYDLFTPGLDLVVGAQRLAWGTADGFNPTDRLNPYDLEDPTRFDCRLSSPAVVLGYQAGPVRIELVALPLFQPAALPVESFDVTSLGDPSQVFDLPDLRSGRSLEVGKVEMPVHPPDFTLENIQFAARISWRSPIGDLAVSYFRGFDSLPQGMGKARLTGFASMDRVDLGVPLGFPRTQVLGATYRGHLVGTLAAWCEIAVVFPEEAVLLADATQLDQLVRLSLLEAVPDPIPSMTMQQDTPYVNAIAGFEVDLPGGGYLNVQYLYGFLTERSAADLHHYVLLALRWRFLDGRLALSARAGVEVADLEPGGLGWMASGGLAYLHGDAVEVELGASFQGGQERSTLYVYRNLSNLRLRVAVKF